MKRRRLNTALAGGLTLAGVVAVFAGMWITVGVGVAVTALGIALMLVGLVVIDVDANDG